jgi:hypothetical protein
LVGVYIVHIAGVVYLETVFQPHAYARDLEIKRFDLDVIWDDDRPAFPSDASVAVNARAFLELDTYSLWYLFPLFNIEIEEYFKRLESGGEQRSFPHGI